MEKTYTAEMPVNRSISIKDLKALLTEAAQSDATAVDINYSTQPDRILFKFFREDTPKEKRNNKLKSLSPAQLAAIKDFMVENGATALPDKLETEINK
jgi:hypothetical protein